MKKTIQTSAALGILLASLGMASCTNSAPLSLEGTWTQPIPGQPDSRQGFTLYADGSAESVNMATLKYKGWSQPAHDVLVLDGMSIGNGVSAPFSDTLRVVRQTTDSLQLRRGSMDITYTRG